MSDIYTLNDADRFNNILQLLMRCCVKVLKKILPIFVTSLGYTSVDHFLSTEKAHILRMPVASLQKNQNILYPPIWILTNIDQWDMSLLTCIFTHIQRKLITIEIGNPVDPIVYLFKAHVLATKVGQEHEEKLYPQSGKPTDLNKWNMSLCSCIFSVVCPKPQTLLVKIAESLNILREMRNSLCHTESPEMELLVYEEHTTVLKDFINLGLTYIGDVAFETEIREGLEDIENGKMRRYIVADHKHLQESYANDRDTSQRLDGIEKELQKLTCQLQKDPVELTLMLFFAKLTDDHKNLLYSSFAETFTQLVEENAPEIVGEINPELKEFFTHSVFQTWKIFNNPFEGRRVVSAKRECLKIKLLFDNAIRMWEFIKIYVSGTLDSLMEPVQTLLRTKEGFENLEMTVVVPDVFAALNQSVEAKEIDSSFTMCVLELLNQRLIPLEDKQQDDSVRKSLPLKLTNIQHDVENADIRNRKMELDESEETLLERKERLSVEEFEMPLEELYSDVSGQSISKAVPLQSRKRLFEEYSIGQSGKGVKTFIKQETPTEEYTIDESGKKVKAMILDEKHIGKFTIDESGQNIQPMKPRKSMKMYSTSTSESKKKQVSYYCEPCFQDKVKVLHVVKCKDCDEMLCSDCARVHRNSKISRNHIMKGQQPDDLTSLKFTLDKYIKLPNDLDYFNPSRMLLLSRNRLLLADISNCEVIMVDLRTNNLMSQVRVPSNPEGMCVLPGDRVAVCLPITKNGGIILFFGALEQLTIGKSIKVGGKCLCIGYHNDRLIVSYFDGKLEVMDMSGKVMRKIDSVDSGHFSFSSHLSVVNEGKNAVIYIPDCFTHTITKLDMDLNILQTIHDPTLRGSADITAVGNQLLICGWISNNIVCLDLPSGKMTELLGWEDGVYDPENVCYSQQQNRLYVKCRGDTNLRVYMPSNILK